MGAPSHWISAYGLMQQQGAISRRRPNLQAMQVHPRSVRNELCTNVASCSTTLLSELMRARTNQPHRCS